MLNGSFIFTSEACAIGPSVIMSSSDFSFQNLVFWNLFEFFSGRNHFKNSIKIFNFSRTFALQVQTSWNEAHAPLIIESFPKTRGT
jgi:hypothetical protein